MIYKILLLALPILFSEVAYSASTIASKIDGLDLQDMTKSSKSIKNRGELAEAFGLPLYTQLLVKGGQNPIDTCKSLMEQQGSGHIFLEAQIESDASSLRDISTTCIAAKLLLDSTSSARTYIDYPLATKSFLQKAPYNLSQMISNESREKLANQKPVATWWNAEPIKSIKKFNNNNFSLELSGSTQTITVMGHGDIDGDGIEDIILKIVDTIHPPATYFNARLYVLTKLGKNQKYSIVRSYER
jgi:hypothetical protein